MGASPGPQPPPPRQALVQVDTGQAEWQGVFSRAVSTRVQAHPGVRARGTAPVAGLPAEDPSPAPRVLLGALQASRLPTL